MVQRQRHSNALIWFTGFILGLWYLFGRRGGSNVEAGPTQTTIMPLPPKPEPKPVETREQRNPEYYPPSAVDKALRDVAGDVGVPYELLRAIAWVESKFIDTKTIGFAGEVGIMQVTPIAMRDVGRTITVNSSLYDQVFVGAQFLKKCAAYARVAKANHDVPITTNLNDWAIMYYNGGSQHGAAERAYLQKVRKVYDGSFV